MAEENSVEKVVKQVEGTKPVKQQKKKKEKVKKEKREKVAIGIIIGLLVLLVISVVGFVVISNSTDSINKLVLAAMPESITGEDNGNSITFYIEENKDYDSDKDEPINAWTVYYYDGNNKRIDLYEGHYVSTTADMQVTIGFFAKAKEKLNIVSNVLIAFVITWVFALLVDLIYICYLSWLKREKAKKAYIASQNHAVPVSTGTPAKKNNKHHKKK